MLISPMRAYTSGFFGALGTIRVAITTNSFLISETVLRGAKGAVGPL